MALFTKKTKEEKSQSSAGTQVQGFVSHPVLISPHTTEKTLRNAAHRQYTFVMATRASKREAIKEIEKLYNVHVVASTTTTITSPKAGFRGIAGKASRMKKITVTLAPGEHIDITGSS